MEALSGLWEKLSLTESEGKWFLVEDSEGEREFFLAAWFYTGWVLSMEAIAKTLKLLWRTRKGFEVRDMGNHMVLFIFRDEGDVEQILKGEPSSFDKHLVALKRVQKHTDMDKLLFETTCMWVQIHNLPIGVSLSIAKSIVSEVGSVIECTSWEEVYEGSNFIRLQVEVDVTKPLYRGRKIALRGGQERWVSFKYERMPNICHWCGKLTHMDRDCPIWEKGKHISKEAGQQYGSWMRATIPNLARKSVVRVAGLEDYDSDSVCSEKSDKELERDNPDRVGAMVPSTEVVDPIQNGMEVMRSGVEVNEIGSRVVQTEQGIVDDGNISVDHDVSLETLQNDNAISRDRMASVSEFQVQLEEIDREIARFDKSEGVLEENVVGLSSEARQTPLPKVIGDGLADGVGQDGVKKNGKGKPKSGYTRSIIRNQAKGKGDFNVGSPKEGTSSGPLKRSFGEMDGVSKKLESSKKQRGVDSNDLTVEAGS